MSCFTSSFHGYMGKEKCQDFWDAYRNLHNDRNFNLTKWKAFYDFHT